MVTPLRQGPLARFKVIDLSRVRAGPTAVRQLADWGAEVIKVESPEGDAGMGGERHGPDFQNLHRNKRSMTLNLKSAEGVAILKRLVRDADVLVENYRPDVKFRLGIDYANLRSINPRLVYASISGFGQDGPYRERPGFDQIAQGMGGLMSITGLPGQGPVRVGIPVADLTAGIFCAMGILVALLEREQSGEGQWVQSNLLAAQIAMLDFQAARWTIGHEVPGQAGNDHPTSIPTGVFQTADGYMNIGAAGEAIYQRFCKVLDAPELATDPDFATNADRSKNRARLNEAIGAITRKRTTAAWIDSAERGRRAVRTDLPDERSVRRSAGAASEHHAPRAAQGAGRCRGGRPGGRAVAYTVEREERFPGTRRTHRRCVARTGLRRCGDREPARAEGGLKSQGSPRSDCRRPTTWPAANSTGQHAMANHGRNCATAIDARNPSAWVAEKVR